MSTAAPEVSDSTEATSPTELLGIGRAAVELGVSERALRYYQQLGLITPSGRTPGGMRRYSPDDLARVRRIRELQELLGFNLDEIRGILTNEDRLGELRREYHDEATTEDRRRQVVTEAVELRRGLRAAVDAKLARLTAFRDELDSTIVRLQRVLEDGPVSE